MFWGEFDIFQTFGNGPPDMGIPDAERDNIMHVSYRNGESVLMGSDVPTEFTPPPELGTNCSISYSAGSREGSDPVFAKLSEGGTGDAAAAGHALGVVLRLLHGPVRRQLRARGLGARSGGTSQAWQQAARQLCRP